MKSFNVVVFSLVVVLIGAVANADPTVRSVFAANSGSHRGLMAIDNSLSCELEVAPSNLDAVYRIIAIIMTGPKKTEYIGPIYSDISFWSVDPKNNILVLSSGDDLGIFTYDPKTQKFTDFSWKDQYTVKTVQCVFSD